MADYYEQSLSRPQMLPSRTTWRFAAHGGERQWTTFALTQARACEAVSETKPNNKRSTVKPSFRKAAPLRVISSSSLNASSLAPPNGRHQRRRAKRSRPLDAVVGPPPARSEE